MEYTKVLTQGAFSKSGYDVVDAPSLRDESGQFGFDLSLLAYFSLVSDARLGRPEAQDCKRRIGDALLKRVAAAAGSAPPPTPKATPPPIAEVISGIRTLLEGLRKAGYVAAYQIDDSDADEDLWETRDNPRLAATRLTITLTDSASLRAALVLNGRTSPELARPLVTAWLEEQRVAVSEATEFFLDSTYRSDPLDYRPDQQVLSLTIEPRRSEQRA